MASADETLLSNQPGGGVVAAMRGINALSKSEFENQILKAQAEYAPQQAYANVKTQIANANLLPYKIQASMLSNPLLWMAYQNNPNALRSMLQNFSYSVPKGENIYGDIKMPPPPNSGGILSGLLGPLLNKLLGRAPENTKGANPFANNNMPFPGQGQGLGGGMQNTPSNDNNADSGYAYDENGNNIKATPEEVDRVSRGLPLLPGTGDPASAIGATMTAKYDTSPYEPGKLVNTPQGPRSVTTNENITKYQNASTAIKNTIPVLSEVANEGRDLLKPGVLGHEKFSQLASLAQQYGGPTLIPNALLKMLGVDKELVSKYANWEARLATVLESYMGALNLPQNEYSVRKVADIIYPRKGEDGKSYYNRIQHEINYLKNVRLPQYQHILGGGTEVSNNTKHSIIPSGMNQEEFNQWYLSLDKKMKDRVKNELRGQ